MSSSTVFVSGATGYIASHVVKDLLDNNYKVIGSVRSAEKGDTLKSDLRLIGAKVENFDYEIVEDIVTKGAFDNALKKHPEISVFLHTASPVQFDVKDVQKELLEPAVEGTVNALNAINTYGKNIKRVVITSSYVAVGGFGKYADPKAVDTEESWNPITWEDSFDDAFSGYIGSKKFAEKAAWDFIKTNKPSFKLSTVLPVWVFGPGVFPIKDKSKLNASSEIINGILKLKTNDEVPDLSGWFIDVRDVGKAHRIAFEKDEAIEQRLLLAEGRYTNQKVLDTIRADFPQLKDKLPKGDASKLEDENQLATIKSDKTKQILGFKYVPFKQCIDDSVAQIVG